jgi:hypothetical protein
MKNRGKLGSMIATLKEKFSRSRGRGSPRSDARIFNHPRRDKAVRSGKK